ncbi:DNA repair protein rad52 [Nowakowskiella sp. JEL0407]|nr:DNA repair protein rad52 [Nowakowskiella sp. JEL0407]
MKERPQPPISPFDDEERGALSNVLSKKLGPEFISERAGPGGGKLSYMEGWKAINLANEILGFDGWSSTIMDLTIDYLNGDETTGKYSTGVSCVMRITLKDGTFHEDVGYGVMDGAKTKGQALEKAKKEAVTDALKRTIRLFGNVLGNCISDKTFQRDVARMRNSTSSSSGFYRPGDGLSPIGKSENNVQLTAPIKHNAQPELKTASNANQNQQPKTTIDKPTLISNTIAQSSSSTSSNNPLLQTNNFPSPQPNAHNQPNKLLITTVPNPQNQTPAPQRQNQYPPPQIKTVQNQNQPNPSQNQSNQHANILNQNQKVFSPQLNGGAIQNQPLAVQNQSNVNFNNDAIQNQLQSNQNFNGNNNQYPPQQTNITIVTNRANENFNGNQNQYLQENFSNQNVNGHHQHQGNVNNQNAAFQYSQSNSSNYNPNRQFTGTNVVGNDANAKPNIPVPLNKVPVTTLKRTNNEMTSPQPNNIHPVSTSSHNNTNSFQYNINNGNFNNVNANVRNRSNSPAPPYQYPIEIKRIKVENEK